ASNLDPRIRTTVQAPEKYKKMYPPVDPEYRTVPRFRYAAPAQVVTREARRRDYRAAVTCMDAAIGRLLRLLDEKGIADNTIVIFFSDNGGSGGADNGPLRGHKGQMWEGGIRVPCLVRWPAGGVPAGKVSHAFLTSLELLPSLASAADVAVPEGVVLDGFDWWATLRGEAPSPRREMFWKRRNHVAARVGKWKWVDMGKAGRGLFDLEADIGETHDLSQERPDVLAMVQERLAEWEKAMAASEPRGPFRDY
ncbi:MAG TPA: N-acetylgalactosamine-6-sulfatase, partial [Planctomycetaceae bacterium]|nr:N-acetylgalactosamine-6-sulfatase [Planctomycetaceae bacterium]